MQTSTIAFEHIFKVPMYDSSGHSDEVTSVCISADGLKIVSGSEDNSIKIWNSETGDVIHTLQGKSEVYRRMHNISTILYHFKFNNCQFKYIILYIEFVGISIVYMMS